MVQHFGRSGSGAGRKEQQQVYGMTFALLTTSEGKNGQDPEGASVGCGQNLSL